MLVLSRKLRERIVIGEAVITVLRIKGGNVRIGIEAPDHVPVRRFELAPKQGESADVVDSGNSSGRGDGLRQSARPLAS